MALTLLLVRHGETVYNAEGRYQGQRDIPLSDRGRGQARSLGKRLGLAWNHTTLPAAKRLPGPPVAVYASDLGRAAETASLITEALAVPPVHLLPQLRERDFGAWEGMTIADLRARGDVEPKDAETWPDVWDRMNTALRAIWDAHALPPTGETASPPPVVLVVGHGGSLRAFLCRALGVGHEYVRRFRLDNVSLSIIDLWGESLDQSEGRVALLNDTSHLTG